MVGAKEKVDGVAQTRSGRMVLLLTLGFFGLLMVTNAWNTPESNKTFFSAGDTDDFVAMSKSFPALPGADTPKIGNEAAQRIFGPYLAGLVAEVFGVSIYEAFKWIVILATLLVCLVYAASIEQLEISTRAKVLGLALYIFNPYALRYTLAYPAMVSDILFVLGLSILTLSLLKPNVRLLLLSALVMILGRQTTLAAIPCVLLCLGFDAKWRFLTTGKRVLLGLGFVGVIGGWYYLSAALSSDYAARSSLGTKFIFGLYYWMVDNFDLQMLVLFLIRGLMTILLPLIVFATGIWRHWRLNREQVICWFLGASIIAQPYLAGPSVTEGSIQRISAMALIPLILLAVVTLPREILLRMSSRRFGVMVGLVIVSSFHHSLSVVGGWFLSQAKFGLMQAFIAAVIGLSLIKFARGPRAVVAAKFK